jgi:hypothetical protein
MANTASDVGGHNCRGGQQVIDGIELHRPSTGGCNVNKADIYSTYASLKEFQYGQTVSSERKISTLTVQNNSRRGDAQRHPSAPLGP